MAAAKHTDEATISIRMVWPFTRVLRNYSQELAVIQRSGLTPTEFASPATRIPGSLVVELLKVSLERSGDAALGLHAGEAIEPGDLDVIESAARHCATTRESMQCASRLIRLLDESAEIALIEEGDQVEWRFVMMGGIPLPAGINEFIVASFATVSMRLSGIDGVLQAAHFAHDAPAVITEYERVFRCQLKFGEAYNALVLPRPVLDVPMPHADPELQRAYELRGQELLRWLPQATTVAGRVRSLAVAGLAGDEMDMETVARKLHMSVATLRRRLKQEGTTLRQIVDEVRFDLAKRYLRRPDLAISEIAYRLGFSHVNAFHKAFKRWTDIAPVDYRARVREQNGDKADE
jgi:AraC-like DNA-binding protein